MADKISGLESGRQRNANEEEKIQGQYLGLLYEMMKRAVEEEGLEYLNTGDGRRWLDVMGIDTDRFIAHIGRISRLAS